MKSVANAMTDELNGYLRAKEPGMRENAYAWKTAIGRRLSTSSNMSAVSTT